MISTSSRKNQRLANVFPNVFQKNTARLPTSSRKTQHIQHVRHVLGNTATDDAVITILAVSLEKLPSFLPQGPSATQHAGRSTDRRPTGRIARCQRNHISNGSKGHRSLRQTSCQRPWNGNSHAALHRPKQKGFINPGLWRRCARSAPNSSTCCCRHGSRKHDRDPCLTSTTCEVGSVRCT